MYMNKIAMERKVYEGKNVEELLGFYKLYNSYSCFSLLLWHLFNIIH